MSKTRKKFKSTDFSIEVIEYKPVSKKLAESSLTLKMQNCTMYDQLYQKNNEIRNSNL